VVLEGQSSGAVRLVWDRVFDPVRPEGPFCMRSLRDLTGSETRSYTCDFGHLTFFLRRNKMTMGLTVWG
jgi:hypothetical protein